MPIVAQHIKPPPTMSATQSKMAFHVLAALLAAQFPANAPRKASEHQRTIWATVTNFEKLDGGLVYGYSLSLSYLF